jgi:hypothetical protein
MRRQSQKQDEELLVVKAQTWECSACEFLNSLDAFERVLEQKCKMCGTKNTLTKQKGIQERRSLEVESFSKFEEGLQNRSRAVAYHRVVDVESKRRESVQRDDIESVLKGFICVVTQEILDDPAITVADGHTYERHTITVSLMFLW